MSTGTDNAPSVVAAYRFTGGRYHATPWGAHVNEGLVEWPPSPFRILRALVATGFTRLGWERVEGAAREMLELLSVAPPAYILPAAAAGHTRHYMPRAQARERGQPGQAAAAGHTRHYMPPFKGNTTKVIDAFLRFPTESTLFVRFPTGLPDACRALLDKLLRAQPYLGRAEAWVEAELLNDTPEGLVWMLPEEKPSDGRCERVEVLAPETSVAYATWRAGVVAQRRERSERDERKKADVKGKPFKALGKKDLDRIEADLPANVVDALLQETGNMRREGWSQPPGTRWVAYYRAVDATAPRLTTTPVRTTKERPTTALLALSSDTKNAEVFPSRQRALRFLELLHKALVKESAKPDDQPSACFTGKVEATEGSGHRHASLFPLTLGRRLDRMDHVLVHCPMGLDERAVAALFAIRKAYAKDIPDLFVALAGLGSIESFGRELQSLRPCTTFTSAMPFVPARFLKPRGADALLGQVERELAQRGYPKALRVEVKCDGDHAFLPADAALGGKRATDLAFADGPHFRRPSPVFRKYDRARMSRPPPMNIGLCLRIEFSEAIRGPVAIGYGSHFGLGLLEPSEEG